MGVYTSTAAASFTSYAANASAITLFVANGKARGRTLYNDSTATLYVRFGPSVTSGNYTVQIGAGQYYEFPQPLYLGRVDGVWTSADGGAAKATEW